MEEEISNYLKRKFVDEFNKEPNNNSCLTDLKKKKKSATEKEITLVINKVIANKPMEYTNEDIYYAIDKAFGIKEMIDLSSIKEFCY